MLTLPAFQWSRPARLGDALAHLAEHGTDSLVVAGGTDAVPNLKHRLHEPRWLLSIAGLGELRFIREQGGAIEIGPLTTLSEIARHPKIAAELKSLARAASLVASPQIRNMGTLGGNLCLDTRCTYYNQTLFWREALGFCLKKSGTVCHVVPQGKRCVAAHSSDVAPVLISLGAEIEIQSAGAVRQVAAEDFFVGDGVHNNVLVPGELVTRVIVPAAARRRAAGYQKLRPRGAIDFPMLSVAFAARIQNHACEEARLVVGALGARPRVIGGLDALVRGRALDDAVAETVAAAAYQQCRPLTNVPYDHDYRHEMVPVFVRRAIREAQEDMARGEGT
ncbi:MAG TPA: FAD binding domain-containing protein [Candidatus Udaeobacter sp.]|jgi:4-hydroxybenzoyl-CoA reductase subunit beta|nr:FAD binding domain-containing protein [Candidatus Udaeobacter sp.]